jgi:hypothetical protein
MDPQPAVSNEMLTKTCFNEAKTALMGYAYDGI